MKFLTEIYLDQLDELLDKYIDEAIAWELECRRRRAKLEQIKEQTENCHKSI